MQRPVRRKSSAIQIYGKDQDAPANIERGIVPALHEPLRLPDIEPVPEKKRLSLADVFLAPFRWTYDSILITGCGLISIVVGIFCLLIRLCIGSLTVCIKPVIVASKMRNDLLKKTAIYFLSTSVIVYVFPFRLPDPIPFVKPLSVWLDGVAASVLGPVVRLHGTFIWRYMLIMLLLGLTLNLYGVLSNSILFLIGAALVFTSVTDLIMVPGQSFTYLREREKRIVYAYYLSLLYIAQGFMMLFPYANLVFRKKTASVDFSERRGFTLADIIMP